MAQAGSNIPRYFDVDPSYFAVQPAYATLPWTIPRSRFQRLTGVESVSPPRTVQPLPVPNIPNSNETPSATAPPQMLASAGTADVEMVDPRGNVWEIYNQRSEYEDADRLQEINSNMDVLLVFAGLFSAVTTSFVIEVYKDLKPDQTDLTNQLLYAMLQPGSKDVPTLSPDFDPPASAIRVNILLFTSLFISLTAALAAMTVKQSVGYYSKGLRSISSRQIRARTRQLRYAGMIKWHLSDIVALIPVALHLSLFFFFAGVVDFLFTVNKTVALICLVFAAGGAGLYLVANLISLLSSAAPFRSPFTQSVETIATKLRQRYASIRKSQQPTLESGGSPEGEAIENSEDLWFGDEDKQARVVRLTRTLDVDAIIWLMNAADKTTERHILELCFEKLMAFREIALKNPSCFLRREIPRTFRQLAATCMDQSTNNQTLYPPRLHRARVLCQFLFWYLNLGKTSKQRRWLREHLPPLVSSLTTAFGQTGQIYDDIEDRITARVASRRLTHLHTLRGQLCSTCMKDEDLHKALRSHSDKLAPGAFAKYLTQDIISLTECAMIPGEDAMSLSGDAQYRQDVEKTTVRVCDLIQGCEDSFVDFRPLYAYLTGRTPVTDLSARWRDQIVHSLDRLATKPTGTNHPPSKNSPFPGFYAPPPPPQPPVGAYYSNLGYHPPGTYNVPYIHPFPPPTMTVNASELSIDGQDAPSASGGTNNQNIPVVPLVHLPRSPYAYERPEDGLSEAELQLLPLPSEHQ